jgi:hypothetical protein
MKLHNGMRPQDVVILLKILVIGNLEWQYRDLSNSLSISISEISESLNRSYIAGLIDVNRKKVFRQSLMEFIEYGLKYVFPQLPGTLVTGIGTAHSHTFYKKKIISDLNFVWPDEDGDLQGLAIQPLYKSVVNAAKQDEILYKLLASVDIIRVGKTREKKIAIAEIKKALSHEPSNKY